MQSYSQQIDKLSKNLRQAINYESEIFSYEEISAWVDDELFNNNFIRQNLALNIIWIFSKQRILHDNRDVQRLCSWLYQQLKNHIDSNEYELISGFVIVAIETLTRMLNELPSIRTSLSNLEREKIKEKLSEISIDDRILSFKDAPQFKQLQKLQSIPIVSSFLDHYDELLEMLTGDETHGSLGQIMQYILSVNDVVPDSQGVLGLVDDLYALEQLEIDLSQNELRDIKWKFEMNFPDFQFPIIIDRSGNNLVNRIDDLIKAALYYSENSDLKFKLFSLKEPGPFSVLSTLLGSITKLELFSNSVSVLNSSKLLKGKTYQLIKGPSSIHAEFDQILSMGKREMYMFQTNGNKINIPPKVINDSLIVSSEEELSRENKVREFINSTKESIHGMFPFGLANNLNINFEKVFLVDRKNKLDIYLNTEIEGRSIKDWFGCKLINTQLKESISYGLLSDEPLITAAYSLDSLIRYLATQSIDQDTFHSLNLIIETKIDNHIENLYYLTNSFHQPFKTVNIFSSQDSEYAQNQFKELGYSLFQEHRSLSQKFVHPPRDSLFENYLSRVGSYPEIEYRVINEPLLEEFYELLNFKLKSEFRNAKTYLYHLKMMLLSRYGQLSEKGKAVKAANLQNYINKLYSYTHVHENIQLIIDFVIEHKEFILNYEKYSLLNDSQNFKPDEKILVSNTEYESLKRKGWEDNHIPKIHLSEVNQITKIFVPAFMDPVTTRKLINFPHAEKIIFFASKVEIDTFLKPMAEKRDSTIGLKTALDDHAKEEITKFEEIFLDLDLDFSSYKKSLNHDANDFFDARIFLFENNSCLALPLRGDQIISHDLINIKPEELSVNDIECGDFLIRPDTNHGDLQDSILDVTVKNIDKIRSKASLWKSELENAFKNQNLTIDELVIFMQTKGNKRHPMTVKNWFKSPTLIAPKQPDEMFKIFAEFLGKNDEYFNECLKATQNLYKARNQVLNDLPEYLSSAYFDEEERLLEFKIDQKIFKANIYEVLSYQDTQVSFDNLYRVKDLDEYFEQ